MTGSAADPTTGSTTGSTASRVRRGLAWSMLSNLTLRMGSFIVGIALARILAPEDFGAFAIAMVVQMVLMNLAELGLAADLVRHGDFARRGPTIATVSLAASALLTVAMMLTAGPVARAMGSGDAAPVIRVMALTLVLAGVGIVPYARLQREFLQQRLFAIDATSFVISTTLTVALAVSGAGAMSIAVGRVVAQVVAVVLQFRLSGERLRLGWSPAVAVSGLRFGLPLAVAGLIGLALLNVDNMVVGHVSGAVTLGFYVIAFNVASWPTSIVGTAIRAVAMPAFAHDHDPREAATHLVEATAVVFAVVAPMGAGLAVLAEPAVATLYGSRWLPAAAALVGLGWFGIARVVTDLWIAYLTARGAAGWLLAAQLVWIAALVPAMALAVDVDGLSGAGWAHVGVAVAVVVPVFLLALARTGVPLGRLGVSCLRPTAAVGAAAVAAWWVAGAVEPRLLALLAGGAALVAVYACLELPSLLRQRFVREVVASRRAARSRAADPVDVGVPSAT